MPGVLRKRALAPALLIILAFSRAPGQLPPAVTELDPGIGVGFEITPRVRLDFFAGRESSDEIGAAKWKISGGVSFRTKSIFTALADEPDSDKQRPLVVGANYEFSEANEVGLGIKEHRITVDATYRYTVRGLFLLTDRNRFEFRWVNGLYSFRYRNRAMIERRLKFGRFRMAPYGAAEAFWDQYVREWNRFTFTGGAIVRLTKWTTLDLSYNRMHCTGCPNPQKNLFITTINLFFKRRK